MRGFFSGLTWTVATFAVLFAMIGSLGFFAAESTPLLPLFWIGAPIAIVAIGVAVARDGLPRSVPFLVVFSSVAAVIYLTIGFERDSPLAAGIGTLCAIDAIAGVVLISSLRRSSLPFDVAVTARALRREIAAPNPAHDVDVINYAARLQMNGGYADLLASAQPRIEDAKRRSAEQLVEQRKQLRNIFGIEAHFGVTVPTALRTKWTKDTAKTMYPVDPEDVLPRAKAIRAAAFADEESALPFLPLQAEGDAVIGLWIAQPRPDGDFAVLRVRGSDVEVVAQSTAEWLHT